MRTSLLWSALLLTLAATGPATAQLWLQRHAASTPSPRDGHAMAYDLARQRVVLFGGIGWADTWEWDGSDWTLRTPASAPSGRTDHAMAYDVARQRIVLFGGVGGLNDTWEWDGNDWTQRFPATAPPTFRRHAMAYDVARGRTVLVGANGLFGSNGTTWEWDGNDWTRRTPATAPPATSSGYFMAYDIVRQRTVLFCFSPAQETWEWDGTTWHRHTPASSPAWRGDTAMAYDVARQVTVLFGGENLSILGDTWEWDGTNWVQGPSGPSRRWGAAMAYDMARRRTVLFGGADYASYLGDTWERISDVASSSTYGAGCGQPPLSLATPGRPILGATLHLGTTAISTGSGFAALVLSLTQHDPGIDLTPLGMPGCFRYVDLDVSLAFAIAGTAGSIPLSIPNDPALPGLHVFGQSVVWAPGANALGLLTSNGLDLTLGVP